MTKKDKDLRIYLQGDWDYPVKLNVKPDGVQMGTVFFTWKQVDVLIKMLKSAKSIAKL